MELDQKTLDLIKILFGYADKRETNLKHNGLKLAHYTSADTASKILLNRNIWLRNAASMNDFSEIQFGSKKLIGALEKHRDRFRAALDVIQPGLCNEVLTWLGNADFNHHQHTHLSSLSEHRPDDEMGLLSMWRAYGGASAGVALIFNTDFLDIDSTALSCWSSPVLYDSGVEFDLEFQDTIARFEQGADFLKSCDPALVKSVAFNALQFSILSTKHCGFGEEKEWRIIHLPRESASAFVLPTFETVRGIPEVVYHLPLQNLPGMNLPDVDIRKLLHRVIIGPCQNPYQVASTFEDILGQLGFQNPSQFIKLSMIPLRQNN